MPCCANCLLPFNGDLESLFQIHPRPESEFSLSIRYIGNASPYVLILSTFADFIVGREFQFQGASSPGQAMDQFRQIDNRDFSCVSDVEYFAVDIVLLNCRHKTTHGIRNVSEASRLQPVSVNRDGLSVEHVVNEDRLRPAPP